MATEIFRFMTIRPPQELSPGTVTKNTVDLNFLASDFIQSLVDMRASGSGDGMRRLVEGFIKDGSSFISSRKKVDIKFLSFYESLLELEEKGFLKKAKETFIKIFNVEPKEFVNGDDFRQLFVKVANSIVAAAIEQNIDSKVRSLLVSLAKTLGLIQKLTALNEGQKYSKSDFHSQIIIMPEGIFPLPAIKQDLSKLTSSEKEKRKRAAENQEKLLELSKELKANRNAINDLLTTFEKSTTTESSSLENREVSSVGFTLSPKDANILKDETKAVLKKIGLEYPEIDVASATSLIERQSIDISNKLYGNRSSMRYMVNVGTNYIPSDTLITGGVLDIGDASDDRGNPGICPPVPDNNVNDDVTVPVDNTHGEARVLGIANLMVVEQSLLRYELGEITHIENVLKSELREREFRTATTTEQSTLTETEVVDEKTKDLISTERFELQTESEKVINENTSTAAGVTVNASYGPSVDVTANFNYTNSNSKQESNRASANFARETTSRATSKIQKRTLERRFVKTVNEIEEKNKHSFDNTKDGAENITGVYRFVDKIYHAQIINYGKRLMLEFVVPEPAAFLRYAMTKQPPEGLVQIKPEVPGYCKDNNFIALQPQDLDSDNYLYWASKYLAEDVVPPPSYTQTVSGSVINETAGTKSQFTEDIYEASELKNLKIPDGYIPLKAVVTAEGWNVATAGSHPATFTIQIQNQIFFVPNQNIIQVNLDNNITDQIPISVVTKNYEKYAVVANIVCMRTLEKFQEWQIKTYNSIMNAYNDQKSRYDNAILAARIRAEDAQLYGTNPLMNRECEKTELKKGCIALLTAQNFETFDSMRRNVAPHGYPEIAFADANAEGRYIQFFENAFEWVNMTYIFYPYFWGKKDDWVTISQISDTDPLYTRFLQAGAGRVQVPVRPGFDISMLHYLKFGNIWYGEGTVINTEDGIADPLHLSVLDELKEQLGNQNIEGTGRLSVKKDDIIITGIETEFSDDDENKRIIIKGKTYLIKKVVSSTEIQLTQKYNGANESDVPYSLGAKLVGEPWEVKLPTNLVMIDEHNTLNSINEGIEIG